MSETDKDSNQNILYDSYTTPLTRRYASKDMCYNFSDRKKIITWRKLWLYLAKAQQSLGIKITDEQLEEMGKNIENINFDEANTEERLTKHDVMAHLRVYSRCCAIASPIIHLGATSCYLTDNSDLIHIRDGLDILIPKLLKCIKVLSEFCEKYKSQPTLGYTHFQPAQLTTVGKRACLWLSDLVSDFQNLTILRQNLKFRGCKGTVGTQASYLTLFNGDYEKICTDIRLLCGLQEIREPFDHETQVGSSAMPYKHNPIRCERCCGLSRHLSSLVTSILFTHSVQWLERSLDDSSNRRIVIPEAFLIADVILETILFIFNGLTVYPMIINQNIEKELPFLSVENILIEMVTNGADRQECHERLRILAHDANEKIKSGTASSQYFIESLKKDEYFSPIHNNLSNLFNPSNFIGAASLQ
ncbi:hypothetical protein HZS_2981, partial [Henneguya salminicola]